MEKGLMIAPAGRLETFRELRQRRGFGQADLARVLGVRPESVWNWDHGRRPKPATLRLLAKTLDVPIERLTDPAFWVDPDDEAEAD